MSSLYSLLRVCPVDNIIAGFSGEASGRVGIGIVNDLEAPTEEVWVS